MSARIKSARGLTKKTAFQLVVLASLELGAYFLMEEPGMESAGIFDVFSAANSFNLENVRVYACGNKKTT